MRPTQIQMSILSVWSFALVGGTLLRADDLPKRMNFDRYEPMLKQPLFAIATAAVAPAATPNFAKDLYVANAARSPEGDMVTIGSSSDANFKKYLTTKAPVDGYSIAGIEWSDRVGATKVTISKDGQFATLSFNEALLSQRTNAPPPALPQPRPNAAVPNVPRPVEGPRPGPGRTPYVRSVIPRYPGGTPPVPVPPTRPPQQEE
jgi:hypothetical protein